MTDTFPCGWAPLTDQLYRDYHDHEWGVPERDGRALWEKLQLDGMQAGLSWITILRKRENYRAAFDQFDPEKVARYDEAKITDLLNNPGIVRNRAKIRSAVNNAQAVLRLQDEQGSLSDYLWSFVDGQTQHHTWAALSDIPAETDISRSMSKDLKKRGFTFVGPTICYAMMQAVGMVNDHTLDCFRRDELASL